MTTNRIRILPYRQGSRSAKALSEELGGKVLKLVGSKFKPKYEDLIINWGNSRPTSEAFPNWHGQVEGQEATYLNFPFVIQGASDKLMFFKRMESQGLDVTPKFWTDKESIPDDAFPVVCRTTLNGHSGDGIVIANDRSELVNAPLYVQYVKKKDEYRVHVGRGPTDTRVIAVQRKARRQDCEAPNWQIRNLANGFVFVRNECDPPESVLSSAIESFRATALDFGAVDVIYNDYQKKAYVLEINTAPGLEGQTVKDYADFFKSFA